ncbi:MAG: polysaccharide biosynthesis/export family protein [Bacteroidaceae bacterium]|nr:polysaccharide biosynthesis/export family protein [Bacteroidaceae bacterium]
MRTLKNKNFVILSLLSLMLMASCTSYKRVPYLQNSEEWTVAEQTGGVFEPKIQPNDLLNIIVTNPNNPTASLAYNLVSPSDATKNSYLQTQPTLQSYIVDINGDVVIPNVGKVNLGGKTISEAEQTIFAKVQSSFSSTPVVIVRFVDFKISVLGEVTAPGSFVIKNGKVTILEALALARDLTIYGRRDNVKVIRENSDGKREIVELNLNDASILNSPYYNLQQNDVVYVTPNESKAKNSDIGSSTSLWFSGTSIFISLTSLLYNILKN